MIKLFCFVYGLNEVGFRNALLKRFVMKNSGEVIFGKFLKFDVIKSVLKEP